jgi:hypothetical protein
MPFPPERQPFRRFFRRVTDSPPIPQLSVSTSSMTTTVVQQVGDASDERRLLLGGRLFPGDADVDVRHRSSLAGPHAPAAIAYG